MRYNRLFTDGFYGAVMKKGYVLFLISIFSLSYADENQPVKDWSKTAIEAVGQLDYQRFDSQLSHSEKYFTPAGWSQVQGALTQYQIQSMFILQHASATTGVHSPPQLVQQWKVPGADFYEVKVLSEVAYHSLFVTWDMPVVLDLQIVSTKDQYLINHVNFTTLGDS